MLGAIFQTSTATRAGAVELRWDLFVPRAPAVPATVTASLVGEEREPVVAELTPRSPVLAWTDPRPAGEPEGVGRPATCSGGARIAIVGGS